MPTFHRPLGASINGLMACGLFADAMREIARPVARGITSAVARAETELQLFLAPRAHKR